MAVRSVNIQINDVATPPPTISKEGNWLLYDGEKWVDTGIRAVGKDVDPTLLEEIQTGLSDATKVIEKLDEAQQALKNGLFDNGDVKSIQYLLDSLQNGSTTPAGGLLLTNDIILSDPNSKDVTAMISGTQAEGAKVMRLGINYTCDDDKKTTVSGANAKWGVNLIAELNAIEKPDDSKRKVKLNELGFAIVGGRNLDWTRWEVCKRADLKQVGEATAFNNNGLGHIGELFFNGNYIGFGDALNSYMQVGGKARTESDMVNASTEMKDIDLDFQTKGGRATESETRRTFVSMATMDAGNREVKFFVTVYAEAEAGVREIELPNGSWKYLGASASVNAHIEIEHKRNGTILNTMKSGDLYVKAETTTSSSYNPQHSQMPFDRKSGSKVMELTATQASVQKEDVFEIYLVADYSTTSTNGSMLAEVQRVRSIYPKDTSKPEVRITQDKTSFFYGRSKYMLLNYDNLIAKIVGDVLMQGNLNVKGTVTADTVTATSGGFYAGGVIDIYGNMRRWVGRKLEVRKISTGRYKIIHNLGHTDYCIQAMAINVDDWNTFVIQGSETTTSVEVGVMWSSNWRNGSVHFSIFAKAPI